MIMSEVESSGKTKTQVVIEALTRAFGLDGNRQKKSKLQELKKKYGRLSKEDLLVFEDVTKNLSEIDSEMWK